MICVQWHSDRAPHELPNPRHLKVVDLKTGSAGLLRFPYVFLMFSLYFGWFHREAGGAGWGARMFLDRYNIAHKSYPGCVWATHLTDLRSETLPLHWTEWCHGFTGAQKWSKFGSQIVSQAAGPKVSSKPKKSNFSHFSKDYAVVGASNIMISQIR